MMRLSWWLQWVTMAIVVVVVVGGSNEATVSEAKDVKYDGRSLIIGGQRKILFSGSIHYPRSTPQMWPSLIRKAKEGGIDVIETYVFWNQHEPQQGQYNFEGRNDLVRFIKEIHAQGLYVTLRIGPFIQAEWTYGGLPFWLHDIPGIVYRSDNEPFKYYMQNFTTKIIDLMKSENLFAPQGGPIILSQIENEYKNVEAAFHEKGPPYVHWAAKMAVDQQTGVPWVMCKQDDAPDPVINACNGRQCGETFVGPNSPNKPAIWTENWTFLYQAFGQEPKIRSPEDLAYHVALFIVKKSGSYINYYMYHGGTNLGRTGSPYVLTSYYDQAPLDEYGLIRQPLWGHLKELHAAVKLVSETVLFGTVNYVKLGDQQEAYVYQRNSEDCAAFLLNNNKVHRTTVNFRNVSYAMTQASIIILKDCKEEIFNTGKVSAKFSTRSMKVSQMLDVSEQWQTYKEATPNFADTPLKANELLEHMTTTKDASDYLWYTFSFQHRPTAAQPVLHVFSLGHVVHAYVNNKYIGYAHGDISTKNFTLQHEITLNHGTNNVSLLSSMFGLPDSGAYLEKRVAGIRKVTMYGTGKGTGDFSKYPWGYQIGLLGEKLKLYTNEGSNKVHWSGIESTHLPLTWYKAVFDAPQGDDPVVLNLESMSKGEAWVNGQSIGRYWSSFRTPKGNPSQSLYHVPRSFLQPSRNLLVLLEEVGGNPLNVSIGTISTLYPLTVSTGTISTNRICGRVSDSHRLLSDQMEVSKRPRTQLQLSGSQNRQPPITQLECPSEMTVSKIVFASFGNPHGDCFNYTIGSCHSTNSKRTVEQACLGKNQCSLTQSIQTFGQDPCPRISKSLKIEAQCG